MKLAVFSCAVGLMLRRTLAFGQPDNNKPDPVPAALANGRDLMPTKTAACIGESATLSKLIDCEILSGLIGQKSNGHTSNRLSRNGYGEQGLALCRTR